MVNLCPADQVSVWTGAECERFQQKMRQYANVSNAILYSVTDIDIDTGYLQNFKVRHDSIRTRVS